MLHVHYIPVYVMYAYVHTIICILQIQNFINEIDLRDPNPDIPKGKTVRRSLKGETLKRCLKGNFKEMSNGGNFIEMSKGET